MRKRLGFALLLAAITTVSASKILADDGGKLKASWINPGGCVYCGFDDDKDKCTCVATEE